MSISVRPKPAEYASYYGKYIERVPEGDVCSILERQIRDSAALLRGIPESRGGHRYEPGKWSIRELVGHVVDTERIFATRALCFSRKEAQPLPGMDQEDYVQHGNLDRRALASLIEEWEALRRSNVVLFRSFDDEMLARSGVASGNPMNVRSILWIVAGHELHHMGILKERYL